MDAARPRLLLIGLPPGQPNGVAPAAEVVAVSPDPAEIARRLGEGGFTAVLTAPDVIAGLLERFHRDELIIGHIDKGLAVLDPAGTVIWANAAFHNSACTGGEDPVGKPFLAALGGARPASVERVEGPTPANTPTSPDPLDPARHGCPTSLRLHCPRNPDRPYLEVDIRPVVGPTGAVTTLIAVARDVTPEVVQQQKLDALHAAGRELAGLDPDQLADMNTPTRIELLKQNLRRSIRDLLHYDTIEVRVLDRRTGKLKPLLEDGMTPEAAGRELYARPTGNGVTGFVAFAGESYLCRDTAADALYIEGAAGARSSMTVPLKVHDEVIGTLNVESPRTNGFGPNDLQFTELFSKEVAAALHTLELLSAQQECTASQSIEAVNKEIALPIDEVLASASLLIGKVSADPETAAHLRKILDNARLVKESVSRVGRELTPPDAPPGPAPAGSGGAGLRADTPLPGLSQADGLRLSVGKGGAHPLVVRVEGMDGSTVPAAEGETPLAGRRVLVVDPDERVRRQAHLLLTRLGATAETTGTATAGLAMASDNGYDAIFLDVKPPDMGGYECFRRFRAARPESTLALTTGFGYDVAHSIVKARQEGLRYVLFKPFREEQVVTAVLDVAAPAAQVAGSV
ncbi:MAG: transcriptional regulator [Gemmataceae bacterium]|nr:transcriptional regulator [Gemmataceae bacterium]